MPVETDAAAAPEQDEVLDALRFVQQLVWTHPVAMQRAFGALVSEGRAFAQTEEGAALKAALERSQLAARARLIWDTLSLGAFTEREPGVLPSVFIDAMARAVRTAGLEALLSRVYIERM